jgi:predicted amidohydrolase
MISVPESLVVTLVQTSLHWEDIDANLQMLSAKTKNISVTTDLIVLPEMFTTGFSMYAPEFAEEMDNSRAINWMRQTAISKNCVVTGSLIIAVPSTRRKGKKAFYNRLIWMKPDGNFQYYDKRHLFGFSKEEEIFTAGSEKLLVELKGWKICPLICYDLRFPVWSRNRVDGYDLLIYVANWPERRIYAWRQLLVARAIENQAFVIGVNRTGNDGNDIYHSGDSMVVNALGNILYHKQDEEDVFTTTLNYEDLKKVRETFRFLKDADAFSLSPKLKIKAH